MYKFGDVITRKQFFQQSLISVQKEKIKIFSMFGSNFIDYCLTSQKLPKVNSTLKSISAEIPYEICGNLSLIALKKTHDFKVEIPYSSQSISEPVKT